MARIVKEHTVRRDEILDAGQRLIYTKGYERMTIQDILDELHISKGAFYHYFDSKQALLEAVITRMVDEIERRLTPILHNPDLPAREKFQQYFDVTTQVKTEQKPFLIALMRVWYTDENAIVREKVRLMGSTRVVALLKTVIDQGIDEGAMHSMYSDQLGSIVYSLMIGVSESLATMLLAPNLTPEVVQASERIVAAYTDALELVLGMPSGSLSLVKPGVLQEWVDLMNSDETQEV